MATNTSGRFGLGWYREQIKATLLLTAEEEKQLARRIREHSDPVAREQMVQANLRLVVNIAKEYSNPGMTLNDLVAVIVTSRPHHENRPRTLSQLVVLNDAHVSLDDVVLLKFLDLAGYGCGAYVQPLRYIPDRGPSIKF